MSQHAADGDLIVSLIDTAAADLIEPKVKGATAAGAGAAGVVLPAVLWLLGAYVFPGGVPVQLQALVGLVVTGVCTFLGGYYARHVDRAVPTDAR
jgi:hypothetical protein